MHGGPAPDRHSVEQARRPQEREADTHYGLARQSHGAEGRKRFPWDTSHQPAHGHVTFSSRPRRHARGPVRAAQGKAWGPWGGESTRGLWGAQPVPTVTVAMSTQEHRCTPEKGILPCDGLKTKPEGNNEWPAVAERLGKAWRCRLLKQWKGNREGCSNTKKQTCNNIKCNELRCKIVDYT